MTNLSLSYSGAQENALHIKIASRSDRQSFPASVILYATMHCGNTLQMKYPLALLWTDIMHFYLIWVLRIFLNL